MCNRGTDVRHIQAISFGPSQYGRQFEISKTLSKISTDEAKPGFDANNELDNRDDTIYAGANWRLLITSGQLCDVYGLHNNFKGVKDVPIAIVSRVIPNEHERVHILVINQSLYFGSSLYHSLISPNQIRHFRIPVSDNPYDSRRYFGINHDNQFILFKIEGSTVFKLFCANG